jgi:tetratricopeptide (TPR) repeat protein
LISEEEKLDLIDKYILNTLTELDQVLFKELMLDETFQQELEEHQHAAAWIRAVNKNKIKEEVKQFFPPLDKDKSLKRPGIHIQWYAAAAAVLIFVTIAWFTAGNDYQRLYNTYFIPFDQGEFRGNNPSIFEAGLKKYHENEFEGAIVLFQSGLSEHPTESILLIYIGNSYLQLKDWPNAKEAFAKAMQSNNQLVKEHATWYLALTFIRLEDIPHAKGLLEELSEKSLYAKESKTLQRELK